MQAYLLCASPRSGSTLLCRMLTQAGAGKPHSFFRQGSITDWASAWGLPAATPADYGKAYVSAAIASGTNGTSVFGLRSMWDSMRPMFDRFAAIYGPEDDATQLNRVFGSMTFIHLSRRDKIAEAVSLAIAEQTGLWHRHADGSILEQTKPLSNPVYDRAAIAKELTGLHIEAEGWANWFTQTGIEPLSLTYEDLATAPQNELARVLDHIGMDPTIARTITPPTARLANQTNQDWRARYCADMGLA